MKWLLEPQIADEKTETHKGYFNLSGTRLTSYRRASMAFHCVSNSGINFPASVMFNLMFA